MILIPFLRTVSHKASLITAFDIGRQVISAILKAFPLKTRPLLTKVLLTQATKGPISHYT